MDWELQTVFAKQVKDAPNNSIFQQIATSLTPVVIDDLPQAAGWLNLSEVEPPRVWLCAPLRAHGMLVGLIEILSPASQTFTPEHCDLIQSFADQIAIAIGNACLIPELQAQARLDSLTRVLNHGTLIDELRGVCERGEASALIMLDLDNFKDYNDNYGHLVGDEVLRATAQAIQTHIKQKDFVGRWGGDEFCVVLRGADEAQAMKIAQRIRATLAKTHIPIRGDLLIRAPTASQGISALPGSAQDVDRLIDLADSAMYFAKCSGRDRTIRTDERPYRRHK